MSINDRSKRFKPVNQGQILFFELDPAAQLPLGSFEAVLNDIVDQRIDTAVFDHHYQNEVAGCKAYDPAMLLKVVLYAYHRGLLSSREIERACRENATFVALSGDSRPKKSTIAAFISRMDAEAKSVFTDVLQYCDHLGLIGGGHLAIDGCKLPSNASKQQSGYRRDFVKRREKLQRRIEHLQQEHQAHDAVDSAEHEAMAAKLKQQQQALDNVEHWLKKNTTDRQGVGKRKKPVQSNLTDPDSAKMKTSHGVIQGYTGISVVDDEHQIVVHAQTHGQGQENNLLIPSIDAAQAQLQAIGKNQPLLNTDITADSGFSETNNLKVLKAQGLNAYIADKDMYERQLGRGARDHYKTKHRQERKRQSNGPLIRFEAGDFTHSEQDKTLVCPNGKALNYEHQHTLESGSVVQRFRASASDCQACGFRKRCLKRATQQTGRQVQIKVGHIETDGHQAIRWMQERLDSEDGKRIYAKRLGCVEPVFGNHRNHRRDQFTLRGKTKVNSQWLLFNAVHNIGKCHSRPA